MSSCFKRIAIVSLPVFTMSLIGCNHGPLNGEQLTELDDSFVTSPTMTSGNHYSAILAEMGFNTNGIKEGESHVIVEGDIGISKASLDMQKSLGKTTQRRYRSLMTKLNAMDIRLKIDGTMSDYTSVIQSAVGAWNNISWCAVTIHIVTSNPDITIYSDVSTALPADYRNLLEIIAGQGKYPENGNIGAYISINKDNIVMTNDADRIIVLEHELGHNLGLTHTDDLTRGIHIPSTPSNPIDIYSLMSAGQHPMNNNDRQAMLTLYPTNICMLRYFNASNGDHFYTNEISELGMGNLGYTYERVMAVFYPYQYTGTVPLYRFWHSGIGDHFYTTYYPEGINAGYNYEGVIGYIATTQMSGSVPLYRYWNTQWGNHFYTIYWDELGAGDGVTWIYEGVVGYVKPNPY